MTIITFSPHNATIFASELPHSITNTDLELLFEQYGDLRFVEIIQVDIFLCMAYIHFENVLDAFQALEALNGTGIQDRIFRLSWAYPADLAHLIQSRGGGGGSGLTMTAEMMPLRVPMVQVLFSFICSMTLPPISVPFLFEAFCPFGIITEINLKKVKIREERGTRSGYGFISFAQTWSGLASSIKTVRWFTKKTIDGVTLDAKFGEQFKRYLQRNRFLCENDPILINKAPATNPSVLDIVWPEVPPPAATPYQQGQRGQQQQHFPSLDTNTMSRSYSHHSIINNQSNDSMVIDNSIRQSSSQRNVEYMFAHAGRDEARDSRSFEERLFQQYATSALSVPVQQQQQPCYYQEVTTTLMHRSNPSLLTSQQQQHQQHQLSSSRSQQHYYHG